MQLPRYEGYGMVPLEGLASGVPFVGSDAGYYHALSAQGQGGTILPFDAHAASSAAQEWLSRTDLKQITTTTRKIAETQFNTKTEAESIGAVYQELWDSELKPPACVAQRSPPTNCIPQESRRR